MRCPMSNNPTTKKEWEELSSHSKELQGMDINSLFTQDPKRFEKLSKSFKGIFLDYSKQHITEETIKLLCDLLRSSGFEDKRRDMFEGKNINTTENRAVLHTALRDTAKDSIIVDGQNVVPEIQDTLTRMEIISDRIRNGKYTGATGKPIKTIVSLGTGGSDLGPKLVCDALENNDDGPSLFFVSNIDGDDLQGTLAQCDPETTMFVVISKSFKTQETLANANAAKEWLNQQLPANTDHSKHFIAVSTSKSTAQNFGISDDNYLPMWDWVNGRFSLWSAVGLPICLKFGFKTFKDLLSGAYAMDQHFLNTPFEENLPILMALVGVWNRNFLGYPHHAILPYAKRLSLFPDYLQQLEMESNGKNIDLDGNPITDYKTCPIIFGSVGTNSQHSFYQLLHQGSETVPCDFIGIVNPEHNYQNHHNALLNNMLAQAQAFMQGQQNSDAPHKYFPGNKPSSTLLTNVFNAHTLGMLIALYEHKCFTQGVIWNVNSFDQFGVELGKALAGNLDSNDLSNVDPSTKGLHSFIHKLGK